MTHGKKLDKETQSPMLKIFKDMMQKEKTDDPEKATLLKEKHDRPKRRYSSSRNKSVHKSLEACSAEKMGKLSYNKLDDNMDFENTKNQTYKDSDLKQHQGDDTCSCVSCPLCSTTGPKASSKKRSKMKRSKRERSVPEKSVKEKSNIETDTSQIILCQENRTGLSRKRSDSRSSQSNCCLLESLKKFISSDNACVALLVLLFVLSIVGTICLLYKSIPCLNSETRLMIDKTTTARARSKSDADRSKRKIDDYGGKLNFAPLVTNYWDPKLSRSYEPPFDTFTYSNDNNVLDFNIDEEDVSKMLNLKQLNNIQGNNRLREFYKKLIDTDIAIRNLKRNVPYNAYSPEFLENQERFKRSLKLFDRPLKILHLKRKSKEKMKLVTKTTVNMSRKLPEAQSSRGKRNDGHSMPDTFVIEKDKVVIQYKPYINRVVTKCSHAPKDATQKSHESLLNHPFYKNTQRLDELLDQVLEKRVPDIMADQFGLDLINKNGQTTIDGATVAEAEDKELKELKLEERKTTDNGLENDFFEDLEAVDKKREGKSSYDILLSVSTIIKPTNDKPASPLMTTPIMKRAPNLRKLLEADVKEDGSLVYEDLKDIPEEKEGQATSHDKENKFNQQDSTTLNVNNPNWKGPMPLYPEELNSLKTSSLQINSNFAPKRDEVEIEMNDVEYVEDYLDNTFDKLAKLAQAYSDYGVLNEKKDSDSERKAEKDYKKAADGRVKLSIDSIKNKLRKSSLFMQNKERPKKGPPCHHFEFPSTDPHVWATVTSEHSTEPSLEYETSAIQPSLSLPSDASEGFKIEYQSPNETPKGDIYKLLQKHIKISHSDPVSERDVTFSPTISTVAEKSKNLDYNNYKQYQLTMMKTSKSKAHDSPTMNLKKTTKKVKNPGENDMVNVKQNNQNLDDENVTPILLDEEKDKPELIDWENAASRVTIAKREANFNTTVTDNPTNDIKEVATDNNNVFNGTQLSERGKKLANTTGNLTMSEFFSLLSHWFSALDGFDFSKKSPTAHRSDASVLTTDKSSEVKVTAQSIPQYDSDMIDNIAHRSRVLLSIEEGNKTNMTQELDELLKDDKSYDRMSDRNGSTESIFTSSVPIDTEQTNSIENVTKRMIKREVPDKGLIFWNDLYDEEYGIKLDPLETTRRDKHSVNANEMKTNWLKNKIRRFADRFSKTRNVGSKGEENDDQKDSVRRIRRSISDDTQKTDFASLTAKMKEVCRDTVKAVEQMKSESEKETSKDAKQATSLMQHLVRLMGDLVDFQVQERTCKVLPPDLQNFLEWLTSSKDNGHMDDEPHFEFEHEKDRASDQEIISEDTKETPVTRSDCLGTLQALQDLMREYEDLSDDDKSLMVGVKDYLQHQKSFLERKLSAISENDIYNINLGRYKRDVTKAGQTTQKVIQHAYSTAKNEFKKLNKAYRKYKHKFNVYSDKVAQSNEFKAFKVKSLQVTKGFERFYDTHLRQQILKQKNRLLNKGKEATLKKNVVQDTNDSVKNGTQKLSKNKAKINKGVTENVNLYTDFLLMTSI